MFSHLPSLVSRSPCKNSAFKEVEIVDNLTETEWDHFCNRYIGQKTHTTPSHQPRTDIPYYKQ